jgi:transposase
MKNCFPTQGKALPKHVRQKIIDSWLEGKSQAQIGKSLHISKQTISNIVNNFVRRGNLEAQHGGKTTRTARTYDVCLSIEYYKQIVPSTSAREIQNLLVENKVCLPQNVPSESSISRCLRSDLGYSYKKLQIVARESLNPNAQAMLINYLAAVCNTDVRTLHFFDESSVFKTTGNRRYGHSKVGEPAIEIQRYASNVTYTVNLLHTVYGIGHVNLLVGPSN